MSTNRTFSNREPRQNLRGVYTEYTTRICETCGEPINSPKGKEYPCVYCKYLGAKSQQDGTEPSPIISGGEVLYPVYNSASEEMPF